MCTRTSARARAAEAVNTLALLDDTFGDNTDGVGLVRDIEANLGFSLAGKNALLLAAGGAARGVVATLLEASVTRLVIANRTVSKARALAARFAPASAAGYELPLPASVLATAVLAYDMVYGRDTRFLAAARGAGARACDGLGMLVEQAAKCFFLWRGVRPPTGGVLAELCGR